MNRYSGKLDCSCNLSFCGYEIIDTMTTTITMIIIRRMYIALWYIIKNFISNDPCWLAIFTLRRVPDFCIIIYTVCWYMRILYNIIYYYSCSSSWRSLIIKRHIKQAQFSTTLNADDARLALRSQPQPPTRYTPQHGLYHSIISPTPGERFSCTTLDVHSILPSLYCYYEARIMF